MEHCTESAEQYAYMLGQEDYRAWADLPTKTIPPANPYEHRGDVLTQAWADGWDSCVRAARREQQERIDRAENILRDAERLTGDKRALVRIAADLEGVEL